MEYYVVADDGQKYGPANLDTLNEWAQQGRILPTTTIERASDGVRQPASLIPGLILPSSDAGLQAPYASAPQPGTPASPIGQSQPPSPGFGPISGYPRQQPYYSYDQVPPELQGKFNWGAFLLTWIWGLNHKAYITLLSLALVIVQWVFGILTSPGTSLSGGMNSIASPASNAVGVLFSLTGLGLSIYYGIKGYEWAWKSGRFATPDECRRCQAIWGWWGLGVLIAFCICCFGAILFGAIAFAGAIGAGR